MEFEVKRVGGIQNCFVSLPFSLIQTFQSTRPSGLLPQLLTLELRSPANDLWVVTWSGATSTSSAIEVSHPFAECISMPDHIFVNVRAISDVPHSTLVTIEPLTEDDWEIMELNSELAEAAILNQVRIVHEGMRFPFWLHGHTVIIFRVVSVFPKKVVVQLIPGSEVSVAPKRRKKEVNPHEASYVQSSNNEHHEGKVPLRIQDTETELCSNCYEKGFELGVVITSVAFIHPATSKKFSLDRLQLVVIMPRLYKESPGNLRNMSKDSSSSTIEVTSGSLIDKKQYREALVHLMISKSAAKGHIMVAKSLRLYLRASLHSWVYVKACNGDLKKNIPSISLSPCHFKLLGQDNALEENGLENPNRSTNSKNKKIHIMNGFNMDTADWLNHDELIAAFSQESRFKGDLDASALQKGLQNLVQFWSVSQLDAITAHVGHEVNSLGLGNQTLLHLKVNHNKVETEPKIQGASSNISSKNRNKTVEILFVLTITEEALHVGTFNAYEVNFGERSKIGNLEHLKLFEQLTLGIPVSFHSIEEIISKNDVPSDITSLSWMGMAATDVISRLLVLLSPSSGSWFSSYNFPLPGHILIHGPSGSGKTLLARAVAKSLEKHEDILAHTIFVCYSRLAQEKHSVVHQELSKCIAEALDHAPSILIFDDLDSIISSNDSEGSQPMMPVAAIIEFLVDIMDEYGEKRKWSCRLGPIAFIACVQSLENVPRCLSSSGRFDFHIQLPAPAASQRLAMLKHEVERRSLTCADDILLDVASKCDGYDAYDLEILVDRTVHAAISRFLPFNSTLNEHEKASLLGEDFSEAMHDFLPVAMRDITKSASDGGRSGWDDVGGFVSIRNAIKEMIELPSKFPKVFGQAPLRLRSNILLYGPPGCGKTHIVGAAAAACSLRFISVKGPELLNKYIGASEQAVRDIFSKASSAAPCLLFFDEFDSIAPKRGHDNTGVTDRVVNQFLTELDGVEVLAGVFVFAATSRPDLLDAALLRPGRLDHLLFCDFPSQQERFDILRVLSRKLPLASDVDLDAVAHMTEGFSGADLQALVSDAQLAAVHEVLDSDSSKPEKTPIITDALLKSTASKARPSVSEEDKRRLYDIYSQFLDSKRSVASQSRDAKGKRATLA